jgi:dihydroorotate dehydrogenase electron transfer subunit
VSVETGPVQVTAEVLGVKQAGAYHHLTLAAPGVAERFRPGSFVSVAVGGPLSAAVLRRALPVYRARPTSGHGGTVESVFDVTDPVTAWLAGLPASTPVDVIGPLGRPFALPKEAVPCVLVADGCASAPLFALAERLRDRGCVVHMLLGATSEARLFGALDARRAARGVTVATQDGSVGIPGGVVEALPDLLRRTAADVVYAAGPDDVLHGVALVAEAHGAWSQTAVDVPAGCGTGLCLSCVLPVVREDGVTRMVRSCTDGPVFRGDRVRWGDIGTVPTDARGAS